MARGCVMPTQSDASVRYKRNIRAVWRRATRAERQDGATWYARTHDACLVEAQRLQLPLETYCGVVAAISPGLRWERNLEHATALAEHIKLGYHPEDAPSVPTYSYLNVAKALSILTMPESDPEVWLRGRGRARKVPVFYRLLCDGGNAQDVVIDTHAADLATSRESIRVKGLTIRERKTYSDGTLKAVRQAYIDVSAQLGVAPHVLQATTWLAWKRIKGE